MSSIDTIDSFSSESNTPSNLPYATTCLVLGIISIATCWLYGVPGLICGIITLVLHRKDKAIYVTNPQKYEQSFKTSKAGFICGIVGLSLSALMLIYFVVVLIFVVSVAGTSGFGAFR